MKRVVYAASLSLLLLSGCRHKDICFEHEHQGDVKVVFDWRNAPDANPASMVTHFFDIEDGSQLRYIFQNRDGGIIRIPYSSYCALAMNSDDNDWVKLRNVGDVENFETYTADAESLPVYGIPTRSIPRAEGTDSERLALTPGMLWSDRQDNIVTQFMDGETVITFYPEEVVCHYTVDIIDIENLKSVDRTEIDGTISGMAEGYNHGAHHATDNHITMPFSLTGDLNNNSLHSEFLTFGESQNNSGNHILTIYLFLKDGTKWYYTFDVTKQVHDASDPRHVHIIIKGLSLPNPITSGDGLKPNVNDWQTENIDVKM